MSDNEDLMIAQIARELKKPERIDPSFDARVMAEIRADRAPRLTPWQWLVRPRSIRISPLGGLGFAGALAASMMLAVSLDKDRSGSGTETGSTTVATETAPVVPVAAEAPVQTVQFVLTAPSAKSVTLVGDFNDWDTASNPMETSKGGMWTITIPLTAGRYTYTFIVDGKRWVADPSAPRAPADDFGQPSSVVTVGASES